MPQGVSKFFFFFWGGGGGGGESISGKYFNVLKMYHVVALNCNLISKNFNVGRNFLSCWICDAGIILGIS